MSEPTTPNERLVLALEMLYREAEASGFNPAGPAMQAARLAIRAQRTEPAAPVASTAVVPEGAEAVAPAFYVCDSDIAALADWRVAGRGAMLHKKPLDGRTAYFAHPPRESGDAEDAARYRFFRDRLYGVDFDYCESGKTVLMFEWPDTPVSAGCDETVDAAIRSAAYQGKEGGGGQQEPALSMSMLVVIGSAIEALATTQPAAQSAEPKP
jgi:hypothetical protein